MLQNLSFAIRRFARPLLVVASAGLATLSSPQDLRPIHVGVILSLTGPSAALGIPGNQALPLWGDKVGGQPLKLTVINDASDSTQATTAARRLIEENSVDVIIGPSYTPNSMAILPLLPEHKIAAISLAGGGAIVEPMDATRKWSYKLSPTETVATRLVFDHMKKSSSKTLGVVALSNAYGDGYLRVIGKLADEYGIKVVTTERWGAADQAVMAQALKVIASQPDAVFIVGPGTPAALPHVTLVQRGYKGTIYQTQGAASPDFLRVGGRDVEGALMAVAPILVAEQLPADNPIRAVATDFVTRFEGKYGPGSRSVFGASAWDAMLLLQVAVPVALKTAKPGTPEFRSALRDALEATKDAVGTAAVYTMSPTDHNGVDARSQVLARIEGGQWKLVR